MKISEIVGEKFRNSGEKQNRQLVSQRLERDGTYTTTTGSGFSPLQVNKHIVSNT